MLTRILVVVIVLVAAAMTWLWYEEFREPAVPVESATLEPPEPQDPEPRHPVPEPSPEPLPEPEADAGADEPDPVPEPLPVLPQLDESDGWILERLAEMLGAEDVEEWLVEERIVERAVVFINNLDTRPIPVRMWPVRPLAGSPEIGGEEESLLWSEQNAARYESAVETLLAVDPEVAARFYVRHYRLFQQAHAELAQSENYFNDRLVDVIDHVLDVPEVPADFEVEDWEGRYRFADEGLEAESPGRKLLLRMGPDNAAAVRSWLREFRDHVAGSG